jgi:hypothetical protein
MGDDADSLGAQKQREFRMSAIEWSAVLLAVGLILVVWQLSSIGARLSQMIAMLRSLDAEVFHLAQEQNPNYGLCDGCGCRAIVRHVIPKGCETDANAPELFYFQSCWWMSDSARVSDENKHYKDRLSERDRFAARVGPS